MNTLRVVILGAILIASLGACSSAGKCRRGELGCACQTETQDSCEPGASCVAERCTKTAAGGGPGGSGGRAGSGGSGGSSTAGADASDSCSDASFDAACRSFCMAFCDSQRDFCQDSACEPGDCDGARYTADVRPVCVQSCGDDAGCAREMCVALRDITCETFAVPADGGIASACYENDPTCELDSN